MKSSSDREEMPGAKGTFRPEHGSIVLGAFHDHCAEGDQCQLGKQNTQNVLGWAMARSSYAINLHASVISTQILEDSVGH